MKGTHSVSVKLILTSGGERPPILPADALAHATAMAEYRAGRDEGRTLDEVDALLTATTPLAFWRAKRGLTQAALAQAAKTTQPHVAALESGKHGGSLDIMARIAKALKVKIDDLAPAE